MSLEHSWIDAGNGILLKNNSTSSPNENTLDLVAFCVSLCDHDMITIKLQNPELSPVAVDTGINPYILQHGTVLNAQISDLRKAAKFILLKCNCCDKNHDKWYTVRISINRSDPSRTEAKITACLPIANFGAPAPDLDAAFRQFRRSMSATPED